MLYYSEVENDYLQRNKFVVWSLGALLHLILSGEEPWKKYKGRYTTIFDHLYFSKDEIPYIKLNGFIFSRNPINVDLRIMLRWCLEYYQIKRVTFDHIENILQDYLTNILIRDINFDSYRNNTRLGKRDVILDVLVLRKIQYYLINIVHNLNEKRRRAYVFQE
jgi:hypothetical protein